MTQLVVSRVYDGSAGAVVIRTMISERRVPIVPPSTAAIYDLPVPKRLRRQRSLAASQQLIDLDICHVSAAAPADVKVVGRRSRTG